MCRKEQGMKKTKELILRTVEKTAQKKLIMDSERWPTCLGILHQPVRPQSLQHKDVTEK